MEKILETGGSLNILKLNENAHFQGFVWINIVLWANGILNQSFTCF